MTIENRTITAPIDMSLIRGAQELERTEQGVLPHRLPASARAQSNDPQLLMVEAQPSGVRIAVRTSATEIEFDTLRTRTTYAGLPPRPDGVIDLVVDGRVAGSAATSGGNTVTIDMATGSAEQVQGPVCTTRFADLPEGVKTIELWLPHNETTELLELRTNAPIEPAPASGRPIWLHHGSSISQGSNATRPTGIWPAIAACLGGVELVNRGFGGSALLDQFTARAMRDAPADLISVKIGINLVNADLMRRRAFGSAVHGFLDTIRDGHQDTPLLVVSPIYCGIHEDTPGPGAFDLEAIAAGQLRFRATGAPAERAAGKLTLGVIREELDRVVGQRAVDDPNLYWLDGLQLYGEQDAVDLPLPDALHPDAATHQLMGERFARLAFGPEGFFPTRA